MKKAIAIVLALLMAAALLAGCVREEKDEHIEPEETRTRKRDCSADAPAGKDSRRRRILRRFRNHRAINTED